MAVSPLLAALGLGGAALGGAAALHGSGLSSILEPLDWPRKSLYNTFAAPYRALESGDQSQLLGAIPGVSGAILGGVLGGGPLGVLAGSALGGVLQGAGEATGKPQFEAPSVSDITGTEDFWPNLLVGAATDPLMYSGLAGSWRAAKPAVGLAKEAEQAAMAGKAAKTAEAIPEAIPLAKIADDVPVAKFSEELPKQPQVPVAKTPDQLAPVFTSRLEAAINGLSGKQTYNAEELKAFLDRASRKGGMNYSQEEVQATNLYDIFNHKPEVTKQELLDHFRQNQIQMEEVWRGEGITDPKKFAVMQNGLQDMGRTYGTAEEAKAALEEMKLSGEYAGANLTTGNAPMSPMYSEYKTPGGVPGTYKEMALKMPERERVLPEGAMVKETAPGSGEYAVFDDGGNQVGVGRSTPESAAQGYGVDMNYTDPHFGEKNTIAFVQMQDRLVNGKKYLEVMTNQSDLHQAGRKGGYIGTESEKAIQAQRQALIEEESMLGRKMNEVPQGFEEEQAMNSRMDEISKQLQKFEDPVPDFPFKDNWHELAMKRMIRHAAENGYEGVIISPGSEVNKMLGTDARSIKGQKAFYGEPAEGISGSLPNWLKKYAKQHGVEVTTPEVVDTGKAGGWKPVTQMDLNPEMRRNVLFKGQPLMQLGPLAGGAGGSALLTALYGSNQS